MTEKQKVVVDCSDDAGNQTSITAGQMSEFWRLVRTKAIDRKVLDWILENHPKIQKTVGIEWWKEYVAKEQSILTEFFGKNFDLSLFKKVLQRCGIEQVTRWKHRGFEIHFLPNVLMSQGNEYPGWKIKPEDWYYNQVAKGKIFRRDSSDQLNPVKQIKLGGEVVLVDIRLKPAYDDDKQMFFQDTLVGGVVSMLRDKGDVAKYKHGDQTSRFGVLATEWQEYIRPALAKEFGVQTDHVRLETSIERNVLSQLYSHMPRYKDGETNTWVWDEEYFKDVSYQLRGGDSGYGGLVGVCYSLADDHWSCGAFRPLVVLS